MLLYGEIKSIEGGWIMSERSKKFLSYYRPYLKLFLADMFCAMIAAGITYIN